ncbi:MAG: divergent polysaccharide deacetylase family protein [Spirochaetaceae bacterium]|nr:divergent polysaccharide deacetylase family protein [Spirochaetaceae bacterium]
MKKSTNKKVAFKNKKAGSIAGKKNKEALTKTERFAALFIALLIIVFAFIFFYKLKTDSLPENKLDRGTVSESGEKTETENENQNQNQTKPETGASTKQEAKQKTKPESKQRVRPEAKPELIRPGDRKQNPEISAVPLMRENERTDLPRKGKIAFMLDDAGNNLQELNAFLTYPGPLTIAVLPGLPYSKKAADLIRASGKTVFLHQPMEAINGQDPGPGAIYTNMSKDEVIAILKKNLNEIGPVAGINNHQGSKITQDKDIMKTVLEFCSKNNLVFLDSRTTAKTVVPEIAKQNGIKIGERAVFLDNEKDLQSMQKQIDLGIKLADKRDSVIMIGHTTSANLADLLKKNYLVLKKDGYDFSDSKDIITNTK